MRWLRGQWRTDVRWFQWTDNTSSITFSLLCYAPLVTLLFKRRTRNDVYELWTMNYLLFGSSKRVSTRTKCPVGVWVPTGSPFFMIISLSIDNHWPELACKDIQTFYYVQTISVFSAACSLRHREISNGLCGITGILWHVISAVITGKKYLFINFDRYNKYQTK